MKEPTKPAIPNRRAPQRVREPSIKRPIPKPHETETPAKTPANQSRGISYECPRCHNTEHPPGAKFCMVCGLGFPLKKEAPDE